MPVVEKDELWLSPCIQEDVDEKQVAWQAVNMPSNELNFSNVESALEITLHEDIKQYFTSIFSETLDANCTEGDLSLLFAWNEEDFSRLQENMIGHILMKRRLKQDITLFFAVTDEEDIIISIDNETGEVCVEHVGCKPHKKLANSLAEFVQQLTPRV